MLLRIMLAISAPVWVVIASCGSSPEAETAQIQSEAADYYGEALAEYSFNSGVLTRSIDLWEKALDYYQDSLRKVEAGYETMPFEEIEDIALVHDIFIKQLQIQEIDESLKKVGSQGYFEGLFPDATENPVGDFETTLSAGVDSTKLAARIARNPALMTTALKALRIGMGTATAAYMVAGVIAIEFFPLAVVALDGIYYFSGLAASIGHAQAGAAIWDLTAEKTVAPDYPKRLKPVDKISIRTFNMGLLWSQEDFPSHLQFWFHYEKPRRFLELVTGEKPPVDEWKCKLCTNNIENLLNEEEISDYLDRHHKKIFVAIDEIRIKHGVDAFPNFGGIEGVTDLGSSRRWRKPRVVEALKDQITNLETLIKHGKDEVEILTLASETIQERLAKLEREAEVAQD